MTVYVDNQRAEFGPMKMCHMVADSREELLAMADAIKVLRKWIQCAGTHKEHFDIALSKRALAVAAGAVEVDVREMGAMVYRRKWDGKLGRPEDAIDWRWAHRLMLSKGPRCETVTSNA